MDRQIVYPGAIPLDTDLLSTERNVMVGIGYLAQATLGTNIVADGLACLPTLPASMTVSIGAGSITQFGDVDILPFGSLPAEPTAPLLRMGTNLYPTSFQLTAPAGASEAVNYLIEASLLEVDATPVVLPYYNANNPSQPYSGPGGDGLSQNTQRLQQVQLQLKAGAPAMLGSQQTPAVDAGWAGLYVITVQTGQTAVSAANIVQLPSAPFLAWKLPQLSPGTRNLAIFTPTTQRTWTVPSGTSVIRLRIWGGGGAGGAGFGGNAGGSGAGGGGAGGGYSEGFYTVSPGETFFATVGNGGVGSGTPGGSSSFGNIASAGGGQAGANGASSAVGAGGASGGNAVGSGFTVTGQSGGAGIETGGFALSGAGGAAFGGGGANAVAAFSGGASSPGNSSTVVGGGGSGGVFSGSGGQGGPGLVLVEW